MDFSGTWYLCGDSTMADYPPERAPMTGWGQMLSEAMGEGARVVNRAVNGRSSRSFIDEGRLDEIDAAIAPGDVLVVSFGHNDEKDDPARHTDAWGSYQDTLARYIEVARRHGATPILATSIARRRFDGEGRPTPTHGDYPAAMRALAAREGVLLADLEAATMALLEAEGPEGSKALFCHVPAGHPNYPDGAADDSHLHRRGALRVAQLFLALLRGEAAADYRPQSVGSVDSALLSREDESVGYE